MTELLGLPYSPWSEKARWALEVRHVPYTSRLYAPLVGEPLLRMKLRKWTGPVTVPVLTDDEGNVIGDSTLIARWADQRGEGPVLFPPELAREIDAFAEQAERGLAAGRPLALVRLCEDDEGLREMVPKALRGPLGKTGTSVAKMGVLRTLRKYGNGNARTARETQERIFEEVLDALRASLAKAPPASTPSTATPAPQTLLGRFTFADIAMTQVLAFVTPPAFGLRIGRATRRSFTDERLRERYADLVAWRDAIYAAYRPQDVMRGSLGGLEASNAA